MRKEGPAEGVAGAGAGGRLRGPAVGVGDRPPRVLAEAAWAAAASRAGGHGCLVSPLRAAGPGWQRLPGGRRLGSLPCSERQRGEDAEPGREGSSRVACVASGAGGTEEADGAVRGGGAGRSRRAGAALRRLPLLHLHMGRRPGRSQGLNDSFEGDPAPGPPGPAPGRCVAHARPPVSSPVSLPRSSPSAPRPPENAAHSVPSPSARTRECRLGLRSAP